MLRCFTSDSHLFSQLYQVISNILVYWKNEAEILKSHQEADFKKRRNNPLAVIFVLFVLFFSLCSFFPPASQNQCRPTPDSVLTRRVYGGRRPATGMQDALRDWTDETAVQGLSAQLCVLTADWYQVWETQLLMGSTIKEKRMLSSGKKIQYYLFSMFTVYLFLEGRFVWK